uniref:Uncharacterized protein n=1 Tax=Arundo donax TaxID=35708 RepID=A0A0A9BWA7_ARUDO
MTLGSRKA